VFNINIWELGAILIAFQQWASLWAGYMVVIHSDSATAIHGIIKKGLRGDAFLVLRQIHIIAAKLDISLNPLHVAGVNNELADAISRFDKTVIANLYPLIQDSSSLVLHHPGGWQKSVLTRPV
jgi:hypothetical protein